MHGAEVNSYNFVPRSVNGTGVCLCTTALVYAIKNLHVSCVRSLVFNYAIYNETTIEYANSLLKKYKEVSEICLNNLVLYEKAREIHKTLLQYHEDSSENIAKEFMKENNITKSLKNVFYGMSNDFDYSS